MKFRSKISLSVLTVVASCAGVHAQTNFTWQGDNNNNWQNSSNWSQDPGSGGIPDASDHSVEFNDSANRFNVDLNGAERTVSVFIVFTQNPNNDYRFFNGTLRLSSNVVVLTDGATTEFDSSLTLFATGIDSLWYFDEGEVTINGPFAGNGAIIMSSGIIRLNSPGTFSGLIEVREYEGTAAGPAIILGDGLALQDAQLEIDATNGLDLDGNDATIGSLSGEGSIDIGLQTLTIGSANYGSDFEGSISGDSGPNPNLVKIGSAQQTFSGSINSVNSLRVNGGSVNVNGGNVTLHEGTTSGAVILVGGDMSIRNGGHVRLVSPATSGGVFRISNGRTLTIDGGKLTCGRIITNSSGTVRLSDGSEAALVIGEVGGNGVSAAFNGSFVDAASGPGTVRKIGSGTLNLTGTNTNTGGISVEEGTLGGTGRVAGPTVVSSGAAIAPGTSAGVLTVADVSFASGASLEIELGGFGADHDWLHATGQATLSGTLDLSYINGFTAAPGDAFVVLVADSISGQFDNVNFPDGQNWNTVYDADAGTVAVSVCDTPMSDICSDCSGGEAFVNNVSRNTIHFTIQDAIDAANFGNELVLSACVFHERSLTMNSKSLTIRGQGSSETFIDGGDIAGTILQPNGNMSLTLEALTLQNGRADQPNGGGALSVTSNGVTVQCDDIGLFGNHSNGGLAGAVYVADGNLIAYRCRFRDNVTTHASGSSSFHIVGSSTTFFVNSLFADDSGGQQVGAYLPLGGGDVTAELVNCTFVAYTGSAYLQVGTDCAVAVRNCVFDGGASAINDMSGVSNPVTRCLYPGATGDNVDGAPMFEDAGSGDYRLAAGSLGIDAANYNSFTGYAGGPVDVGGNVRLVDDLCTTDSGSGSESFLDIGAYEYQGSDDADGDSVPDECDICSGGDDNLDSDGDGVPDHCDICALGDDTVDMDGDGVPDECDICLGGDDALDSDGDSIPDGCDTCPGEPNVHNQSQDSYHPTIQAAIDAAQNGDVIQLGECVFNESNITIPGGLDIELIGTGPQGTQIDTSGPGPAIVIGGQVTPNTSTIRDLSITGVTEGIAMVVGPIDSPVIRNTFFFQCSGDAVLAGGNGLLLDRCGFIDNEADFGVVITEQTILSQCVLILSSNPQVHAISGGYGTVVNCTINATDGVLVESGSDLELINTIVKGTVNGPVQAHRSMFAGAAGDNINMEPVLSDSIYLLEGSPAIDAADYDAYLAFSGSATDFDGDPRLHDDLGMADTGLGAVTHLDIGALEFQGTTSCSDADNDGVCDVDDICPGFDDSSDSDADGLPNGCDPCPTRATGDVSGDGFVDTDDIVFFTSILTDPASATGEELCAADVNEDSNVDGRDIAGFNELLLAM